MEVASPARLYATVVGALLVVLGIVGFFYSASFGAPGDVEAALGVLRVNAWLNLLQVAIGAFGLLLAGYASRPYALGAGLLYTALAIWGFAIGGGDAILGFLPAGGGDNYLHLAVGLLGLAAAAGTPKRGSLVTRDVPKEPRKKGELRAASAGRR
jgi:ABC-type transport system involved in multi-copper enzyme maturation permease subunit